MYKNVAGQHVYCQMTDASDGSDFAGAVSVYVTGDSGNQAIGTVGGGAGVSKGSGVFRYDPAKAETNYDSIAFTFTGTGAITATVQVETVSIDIASDVANAVLAEIGDIPTADEIATAVYATLYGTGSDQVTVQVLIGGVGVQGAETWITTDLAGDNRVAGPAFTDSNGEVTFLLTAGNTYYLWSRKDGMDPITGGDAINPFVAVAD